MASIDDLWLVDFGERYPGQPAADRPALVLGPPDTFGPALPFDPPNPDPYEGALIIAEESSLLLTGNGTTGIAELMQCFEPCLMFDDVGPGGFFIVIGTPIRFERYDFRVDLGDELGHEMTISITNVGDGLLEIVSITLDNENSMFQLDSETCSSGGPMAPDEMCQFDLVIDEPCDLKETETFLIIEYGLGRGPERGYAVGTVECFE